MTSQTQPGPNRTLLIAGGVVAVVILAIVAFILLAGGQPTASPSAEPAATDSPTPIPTEEALNEELLNSRLTILFVGLDVNEARAERGEAPNADSLLLVSISAGQSELALISLPRDTVDLPLPDGGTWTRKVNALYTAEGLETLTDVVAELYQREIDGYVALDMDDFATLVDAVDGITVDPDEPLFDSHIDLDLPAGEQELDGPTALDYVRTRIDQDYGRMGRQQEAIQALVAKLVDPEADVELTELIAGLDSLETDLPLDELRTFVEIARRAQDARVTELVIGPPDLIVFEGDRNDGRGYVLEPDVEAIRERVADIIDPDE
jgi:LCP family protein required for cell wall assembly